MSSNSTSIIRLALIGDDHANTPGRVEEARRVHEAMLDDWRARRVHFIGCSGDWNEIPPTEADQAWSRDFLRRAADIAPVVLIYGNHDPAGSLDEFHLQTEYKYPITVVSHPGVVRVETAAGLLAVACVPFVWKAHLLAQAGTLTVEEADRKAEDLLGQIFLGLGIDVHNLNLPTVALIHGKWRGSKLNEEQPNRPLGMEIAVEHIGQIGAHITNMGHIHLAQATSWNNWPILTPSSCFYVDYGEAKHQKGYVIASLPVTGPITPEMVQVERVPTPVTPMLLLENWWEFQPDLADMGEADFGWRMVYAVDPSNADIRFRFHYPKDQEKAAKATAEDYARNLRVDGAVNVTLDPVVDPAIRSRIPELATATTLEKKAELYRESTNAVVGGDERKILDQMVQEIQEELAQEGVSFGIQSRAVPTLKRIRGNGWLCFEQPFDIDVEQLGDLTALVAPNEKGKTLFMSLAGPGLLYGDTPSRGSLDDLSRARDACIEGTFDMDGREYTLGQVSNAMVKTNKGHVNLTSGAKPILQKAGREEYKTWARKNLLPWNQYLSLLFHSGSEDDGGRKINIIDMKDGARTELMLKVLGIEFYESIAQKARDKAKAVSTELERVSARLSELGQDDLDHLSEVVSDYRNALETEQSNLVAAETELTAQRERVLAIEKQRAERESLVRQQTELQGQEQRLREKVAEVDTLLQNNQELVANAAEIRAAVARLKVIETELVVLEKKDADLRVEEAQIASVERGLNSRKAALDKQLTALHGDLGRVNEIITSIDVVKSAADSIPEFEESLKETEAEREAFLAELETLQSQVTATSDGRIETLRGNLRTIADDKAGVGAPEYAEGALSQDDAVARDAVEHPKKIITAKAGWLQRSERAKEIERQIGLLRREADRLPVIEAAIERRNIITDDLARVADEIEAVNQETSDQAATAAGWAKEYASNQEAMRKLSTEAGELRPLASRETPLNNTETRIGELTRQQTEHQSDLADIVAKRNLIAVPEVPAALSVATHEAAVASIQKALQQCQSGLVLAEKALSDAQAKEARVNELQAQATRLRTSLDRWNRIAREFGVDGLQKEEISNAGESLTSIINELLRAGGDMDHTVDIRTERPHSRESRMIPCFEILITDSRIDGGAPKEARRLSGYGQTVIGKALAMAMTRLGCERAGIRSCTIWFDELCGTATPDNAIRIIGMVRHFAKCLNAKIFFVDQDPDIQALADSRINILDGGRIEVN